MPDWEHIFKNEGRVFDEPVEQMSRAIEIMCGMGVETVLDLGCGTGRHSVELAKAGFDLHAADVSPEALRQTKDWLESQDLQATYHQFSCYERFPFDDNTFDALVSTQVIHHNYLEQVRCCISEIGRVLRPGGFTLITVAARKSTGRRRKSKWVADRTYMPTEGHEEGLPHYLFNEILLREEFRDFDILDIHTDKGYHLAMSAVLRPQ